MPRCESHVHHGDGVALCDKEQHAPEEGHEGWLRLNWSDAEKHEHAPDGQIVRTIHLHAAEPKAWQKADPNTNPFAPTPPIEPHPELGVQR